MSSLLPQDAPAPAPDKPPVTIQHFQKSQVLRRLIALGLFLAALVAFRHLALLGITFVLATRGLGALGGRLSRLSPARIPERRGVVIVLLLLVAVIAGLIWAAVAIGVRKWAAFNELHDGQPIGPMLSHLLVEMQEDLTRHIPAWVPLDDLKEKVPHLVDPLVTYLRATGRTLLQVLIGLILAVIYLLDRQPVDAMLTGVVPETVPAHLKRYFGYLSEAIVITVTVQVLVALVNTVLTLPVLFFLRLPHLSGFTALIFFSSLVPVVGNLVSGAVLIVASYVYGDGIRGVVLFVTTTFVLHKIEAYYLNPRLAARHVNLPSLVLIVSLILFEHAFGLVGLFLSFPALYVGINIWKDLRTAMTEKERAAAAARLTYAGTVPALEGTGTLSVVDADLGESGDTPLPPPAPAALQEPAGPVASAGLAAAEESPSARSLPPSKQSRSHKRRR